MAHQLQQPAAAQQLGRLRPSDQAGIAADEGPLYNPTPPERIFDQNSNYWYAPSGSPGVLVASQAEIDSIEARFPSSVGDTVAFTLSFWEDDDVRGKIVDGFHWYDIVKQTAVVVPLTWLWINTDRTQSTPRKYIGAISGIIGVALGIPKLLQNVWNSVTGMNDDFIGVAVDASAVASSLGYSTGVSHAILNGSAKVGETWLVYRP